MLELKIARGEAQSKDSESLLLFEDSMPQTQTHSTHTWTHMKLTMRRMVDILLCPPPRERSPSFIYWEPNKKEKEKWSGFLLSFQCLFLSGMNRQENGSDQRFMIRWNILNSCSAVNWAVWARLKPADEVTSDSVCQVVKQLVWQSKARHQFQRESVPCSHVSWSSHLKTTS